MHKPEEGVRTGAPYSAGALGRLPLFGMHNEAQTLLPSEGSIPLVLRPRFLAMASRDLCTAVLIDLTSDISPLLASVLSWNMPVQSGPCVSVFAVLSSYLVFKCFP